MSSPADRMLQNEWRKNINDRLEKIEKDIKKILISTNR